MWVLKSCLLGAYHSRVFICQLEKCLGVSLKSDLMIQWKRKNVPNMVFMPIEVLFPRGFLRFVVGGSVVVVVVAF